MERNDVQADRGGGGLSTQDLLEAEPRKEQGPKEQAPKGKAPREKLPRTKLPRDTPRKPRLTSQGRTCSRSKRLVTSVSSGR
jgi:hypothetical protein